MIAIYFQHVSINHHPKFRLKRRGNEADSADIFDPWMYKSQIRTLWAMDIPSGFIWIIYIYIYKLSMDIEFLPSGFTKPGWKIPALNGGL